MGLFILGLILSIPSAGLIWDHLDPFLDTDSNVFTVHFSEPFAELHAMENSY